MRWICRNISGTRREVVFNGTGWQILWRTIVMTLLSVLIIPIPWVLRWYARWYVVAIRAGRRAASVSPTPSASWFLRWRTEPSCATEATSVPSGLKIMPRVSPRPSCALGESCA